MKRIIIALSAALLLAACHDMGHIREVRDNCPCYVHIDFSHVSPDIGTMGIWLQNADTETFEYFGRFDPPYPDTVYVPVEKGNAKLYSWGNIKNGLAVDSLKEIHFVKRPEVMYHYTELLDTHCENLTATIYPESMGVGLRVNLISEIGPVSVLGMTATSSQGYSYSGNSVNDTFTYDLAPTKDPMCFTGLLPVQDQDMPLTLAVEYENGGIRWNTDFDLAGYLASEGINLENTEAVSLTVCITGITGTISIIPMTICQYDITI